jgi:hypothetical protein
MTLFLMHDNILFALFTVHVVQNIQLLTSVKIQPIISCTEAVHL